VTTIGRNFDDIDISALATSLGCVPRDLVTDSLVLEDVVAADPLAGDSPVLLRGIGNIDFDARAASALGIPLLLLIDAPGPHVDVTLQEASALGAVVAAARPRRSCPAAAVPAPLIAAKRTSGTSCESCR